MENNIECQMHNVQFANGIWSTFMFTPNSILIIYAFNSFGFLYCCVFECNNYYRIFYFDFSHSTVEKKTNQITRKKTKGIHGDKENVDDGVDERKVLRMQPVELSWRNEERTDTCSRSHSCCALHTFFPFFLSTFSTFSSLISFWNINSVCTTCG